MVYVLVKLNATVIEKRQYSGDVDRIQAILGQERIDHPELTFAEVTRQEYADAVTQNQENAEQAAWRQLNTPDSKFRFIARRLGFE